MVRLCIEISGCLLPRFVSRLLLVVLSGAKGGRGGERIMMSIDITLLLAQAQARARRDAYAVHCHLKYIVMVVYTPTAIRAFE